MTAEEAEALFLAGMPGTGGRARARDGRRRRPAQGPRLVATRAPGACLAAGRALPSRRRRMVPDQPAGPPPRAPVRGGLGGDADRDRRTTVTATGSGASSSRSASCSRPGSGTSSPRVEDGPGADVSRLPGSWRSSRWASHSSAHRHSTWPAYWAETAAAFERDVPRIEVVVRVRPDRARSPPIGGRPRGRRRRRVPRRSRPRRLAAPQAAAGLAG